MKFLLIVLLSIAVSACSAEVKEATRVQNKYFYYDADASAGDLSWDDALVFCNSNNMNLATIKNKAEQDAVHKWHKTFKYPVFLGGSDKFSEGTWYWQHTRSPITYSNWSKDNPQAGEYNSCIYMSSSNGKWTSSYCDAAFARPLCEKVKSGRK